MRKNWFVWVLCILIFLAGTTWGSISLKKDDFWRVDSVHDLFEIFGVFGTFAAVLLGVVGLNTWKKQIKAGLDNELARRVLISTYKYSQMVVFTWRHADFAASYVKEISDNSFLDERSSFVEAVKVAYKDACDARADFLALQAECKAIWGDLLSKDADDLLSFEEICTQCLNGYYKCSLDGTSPLTRAQYVKSIINSFEYFNEQGIYRGKDADNFINAILLKINKSLEGKLIK